MHLLLLLPRPGTRACYPPAGSGIAKIGICASTRRKILRPPLLNDLKSLELSLRHHCSIKGKWLQLVSRCAYLRRSRPFRLGVLLAFGVASKEAAGMLPKSSGLVDTGSFSLARKVSILWRRQASFFPSKSLSANACSTCSLEDN